MHIICPSMPTPASTELTMFVYISHRKNYRTFFRCWRPGAYAPSAPYPPPLYVSVTAHSLVIIRQRLWCQHGIEIDYVNVTKDHDASIGQYNSHEPTVAPIASYSLLMIAYAFWVLTVQGHSRSPTVAYNRKRTRDFLLVSSLPSHHFRDSSAKSKKHPILVWHTRSKESHSNFAFSPSSLLQKREALNYLLVKTT